MKYEIIKGSEKDFEGIGNEDVVRVYDTGQTKFYAVAEEISSIPSDWTIISERRPITEQVWDVSTPPPVGIECEVLFTSEGSVFERARILHVGDDGVVGRWLTGDSAGGLFDYMYIPHDYRPIRPPEDVARDEAITSLYNTYMDIERSDCVAQGIYDAIAAGKIPGIKLEN